MLEPASGLELNIHVSSFPYEEVPESEYASSIVMSSQQPPLEEPSVLSPLKPTSSMPAGTDDTSYDMSGPPLIGGKTTPYIDLPTGISHQVSQHFLLFDCIQTPVIPVLRTRPMIFSTRNSYNLPVAQIYF